MRRCEFRILSVLMLVILALGIAPALADGDETLGPPSLTIAEGTDLLAAGTGLYVQPGFIEFDLPEAATVEQVILYWGDRFDETMYMTDDTATVNGTPVTATLIGGAGSPLPPSDVRSHSYRVDITEQGWVAPGSNSLRIEDLEFDGKVDGAGVMVIYSMGGAGGSLQILDGSDYANAQLNPDPPLSDTVPQTLSFDAASVVRTATLNLFVGDVTPPRTSIIRISVPGSPDLDLVNVLASVDGGQWDTVSQAVSIPPGADSMTVVVISGDGEGRPASLHWIGAGLRMPPVAEPAIDIRKQAEGHDERTFPSGSDVDFEIVVTNTGNVDLMDVEVTDEQVPRCAMYIGDLAVGEHYDYTCTAPGVTESFENVACVAGYYEDARVDDCDPSTVIIEPQGPGTGTPGYWKNHPAAWPVEEITIGGVTYTKAQAIRKMKKPVKGDKTYSMFKQLVSAKLNVIIGNDDSCIAGTISDADAWMAAYGPVGSGVSADSEAWDMGGPLHKKLDDYNNGRLCAPHRD